MKKFYAFAIAALSALAMNAQTIYMMGSGDGLGWENWPGKVVNPSTDGSYSVTIDNLSAFKMSTTQATGWDDFNATAFGYSGTFGDDVFLPNGMTVDLEPWGENQDMPFPGNYTITINKDRSSMTVKANFTKPTAAPNVYIRGNMNGWGSSAAWQFKNESWTGTSGKWTFTGQIAAGVTFKIGDANWGAINYSTGKSTSADGKPVTLTYNGSDMSMAEDFNGTITLEVSNYTGHVATATFTQSSDGPSYPENLYVIGTINGGAWSPSNYVAMVNEGDGFYTVENITFGENGGSAGFSITGYVGGSWDDVNGLRFGPAKKDDPAVVGENAVDGTGDTSWSIAPGTYNLYFSYDDKILEIEEGEAPKPQPALAVSELTATAPTGTMATVSFKVTAENIADAAATKAYVKLDKAPYAEFTAATYNERMEMYVADLTGLTPGTQYTVTAYAENGTTKSAEATTTFSTPVPQPTVLFNVGSLTATNITETSADVVLNYNVENAPEGAKIFAIATDANTRDNTKVEATIGTNPNTFTFPLTGLTASTEYTFGFVMQLEDASGSILVRSPGLDVTFTTAGSDVPAAPLAIAQLNAYAYDNSGTIQGSINAQVTSQLPEDTQITVFYTLSAEGADDVTGSVAVSYGYAYISLTDLLPETEYTVTAYAQAGEVKSEEVTTKFETPAYKPYIILVSATASDITAYSAKITVDFEAKNYPEGTTVKLIAKDYSNFLEFSVENINPADGKGTIVIDGLDPETEYGFSVQPYLIDDEGNVITSDMGTYVTVETLEADVQIEIANISYTAVPKGANFTVKGITATGLDVENPVFDVYYQLAGDAEFKKADYAESQQAYTFSFTNLQGGTNYTAVIYAACGEVRGKAYRETFMTGIAEPTAYTQPGAVADDITETTATIYVSYVAENIPTGGKAYVIAATEDGTEMGRTEVEEGAGLEAEIELTGLTANTTYNLDVYTEILNDRELSVAKSAPVSVTFTTVAAGLEITLEKAAAVNVTHESLDIEASYTASNLPEGAVVYAIATYQTSVANTFTGTTPGAEGIALVAVTGLDEETDYTFAVTLQVEDAEGNILTRSNTLYVETKTTLITDITIDIANGARYFNLNGVEVTNPAPGMYIKVKNGETTKVLVK